MTDESMISWDVEDGKAQTRVSIFIRRFPPLVRGDASSQASRGEQSIDLGAKWGRRSVGCWPQAAISASLHRRQT